MNLAFQDSMTQRLYYASDTRADALLIGCLTAFLFSWHLLPFKKIERYFKIAAIVPLVFLLVMCTTANASNTFLYHFGGYGLVAISVAALLLVLLVYKPRTATKMLSSAPLVWIGRVSYGLYLRHWTVRYFIYEKRMLPESNLQLASVIIISLAFTVISFHFIEKPFLPLKERYSHTQIPA